MKKYFLEIKLGLFFLIIVYIIPISSGYESNNLANQLFVLNSFTYFLISTIYARYRGYFYIPPIVLSILFIPLSFTIYETTYLLLVFFYLFISLIGGFLGYWFNTQKEVCKAFKDAVGISSVLATIICILACIVSLTINSIYNTSIYYYLAITLLILLARRCLKKEKKKD